jgi:hypothetical protein
MVNEENRLTDTKTTKYQISRGNIHSSQMPSIGDPPQFKYELSESVVNFDL